MADAKEWAAPDDAHRLIAKALAGLVAGDPTVPPHPYLSRHLAAHAAHGGVLDDAHVPRALLAWESSRSVRTLLRRAAADRRQDWLTAWAGIEPFVRDADPDSRLTSLHLAHHAATRRRTPLAALSAADTRLDGSRLTPLWSDWTAPGNVLATLDPPVESLVHLTTSTGRQLLVSGDRYGTLRLWETHGAPYGAPLHTHGGGIQHLLPLRGDLLVSGGTDGAVRVWHCTRGQSVGEPVRRRDTWVSGLALCTAADAPEFLLVAHGDGHLTALETEGFEPVDVPLPELDTAPVALTGVRLGAGAGTAVVLAQGRSTHLWRPGRGIVHAHTHPGEVRAVAGLTAPGRYATCDDSGHLGFRDAVTGLETATATPAAAGLVVALSALTIDGRHAVVAACMDHTLRLWDADTGRAIGGPLEGHTAAAVALTALPGDPQAHLVSAGADRTLRRWKLTGHGRRPAPPVRRPVTAAALPNGTTPTRSLLVAVADESATSVWDVESGRQLSLPADEGTVGAMAWATLRGEPLLLTAHGDAGVRMWSLETGSDQVPRRVGTLVSHVLPVQAMVGFADGERSLLVTGSSDGSVRLWDLDRCSQLARWGGGRQLSIRDVAVLRTEHGVRLVSAGADGKVRLWDPATGASGTAVNCGEQGVVHAVAAVPLVEGEPALVASGGEDGTVRLWDLATQREVGRPLDASDGPVTALAPFRTPAGRSCLAATGPSGTVHVWDVDAAVPLLRIVTGNPLGVLAVRETAGQDPVLLAAGTAGVCVFRVHPEPC